MKRLPQLIALLMAALLAGCALSPQQVTIAPQLAPADSNIGAGRSVRVVVEDRRESPVIGHRGGVYADTSNITAANDIGQALARAAEQKLRSMGFAVVSGFAPADSELRVVVDTLSYQHPDKAAVGYDVELLSVLGAEVQRSEQRYEGRYRVKTSRHFFNSPSAPHNEKLINEVLAETLERLFADAKLQAFMLR